MLPTDAFSIHDEEPGQFAFGVYRNLTISMWHAPATEPMLQRLATFTRTISPRFATGHSDVHIVRSSVTLPDAGIRAALVRMCRDDGAHRACVAVITGGDGFWASALRGAVTSIWLTMPRTFELRIAGSAEEVAGWIPARHMKRTGEALDPHELKELLVACGAPQIMGESRRAAQR